MATKVKNFTIPEETLKALREYSDKTMIPQSRIVSSLLQKFLSNEKKHAKI